MRKSVSLLLCVLLILSCVISAFAADSESIERIPDAAFLEDTPSGGGWLPFVDVPGSAYYYNAVQWAYGSSIISGIDATHFGPDAYCSRGQFVSLLWRLHGRPAAWISCPFTDVYPTDYYYNAVLWAYSVGLTAGTSATTFDPQAACSRAQIIAFLARDSGASLTYADTTLISKFTDVDRNAYYLKPLSWATSYNIASGTSLTTFDPDRPCTRAEAVTFLYRAKNLSDSVYNNDDRIHYINFAGYGSDCILIESNGHYMLVDAGNPDARVGGKQVIYDDAGNVNAALKYLRSLGVTHLDYLVMTHNHSDHIGGVPRIVEEGLVDSSTTVYYRVGLPTKEDETLPSWENLPYLWRAMDSLNWVHSNVVCLYDSWITQLTVALGDFTIEFRNLDENHDGWVDFYTDDENQNSIVLIVTKGSVSTLLGSDATAEVEERIVANGIGRIQVMKALHHGNRTSNSYALLKAIQPQSIVLTRSYFTGLAPYAYINSQNIPVYAMGSSSGAAIVETVYDRYFTMSGSPTTYRQSVPDGFYYWDWKYYPHGVCIENGQMVRNAWRLDPNYPDYWYWFNDDGIG